MNDYYIERRLINGWLRYVLIIPQSPDGEIIFNLDHINPDTGEIEPWIWASDE